MSFMETMWRKLYSPLDLKNEGRETTMNKIANKLSNLKFEPCEEPYIGVNGKGSIIFGDCGTGAPGTKSENDNLSNAILGDCEIITS